MTASALNGQLPQNIGSTGGLLNSAETEEKYAITWTSSIAQVFELPTGGAATMNAGENLMYFARKEQCLALGTQLRTFKITDYRIFRIFASGEVQFLHPKDGVFPEKSNEGRVGVGQQDWSIGKSKAGWKCVETTRARARFSAIALLTRARFRVFRSCIWRG